MPGADPRVTVLLAVHNGERFLEEAVESVLSQTFTDFEFIVVDDASTDRTGEILSRGDDRMVRVRNEENLGLTRSLNRGLQIARGRYVARLDADDVAEPHRLERQFAYLEAHPEVDVLGTWMTEIDETGAVAGSYEKATHPEYLRWDMTHCNPIFHPTAMMRRDSIRAVGGYDPQMRYAQDHDLWTRVIMAGGRVALLPERLLRYRWSPDQISRTRTAEQSRYGWGVRQRYIQWLLEDTVSLREVDAMMRALGWRGIGLSDDLAPGLRLIERVRRHCRRDCDSLSRREMDLFLRGAMLNVAAHYARDDFRLSAELTRWAARTGWGSLADRRLWKQVARLGIAPLRGPTPGVGV